MKGKSMAQTKKTLANRATLEIELLSLTNPDATAYIEALKRKYQRYAMPVDDARRIVDEAMGTVLLTELLADVRNSGS